MSRFLLDTNVLSEFNRRGEPDRMVKQWLEAAYTGTLYASVLTFGEIRLGVELLPPSKRRTQLEQWWSGICTSGLKAESCRSMSELQIGGDRFAPRPSGKGDLFAVIDALLAATSAQPYIVSRNVSDFSAVGLTVVNPWES